MDTTMDRGSQWDTERSCMRVATHDRCTVGDGDIDLARPRGGSSSTRRRRSVIRSIGTLARGGRPLLIQISARGRAGALRTPRSAAPATRPCYLRRSRGGRGPGGSTPGGPRRRAPRRLPRGSPRRRPWLEKRWPRPARRTATPSGGARTGPRPSPRHRRHHLRLRPRSLSTATTRRSNAGRRWGKASRRSCSTTA